MAAKAVMTATDALLSRTKRSSAARQTLPSAPWPGEEPPRNWSSRIPVPPVKDRFGAARAVPETKAQRPLSVSKAVFDADGRSSRISDDLVSFGWPKLAAVDQDQGISAPRPDDALIFCTVPTPTPTRRAVLMMPVPLASSAEICSTVRRDIRGRPIGLPLRVPFSRARTSPA